MGRSLGGKGVTLVRVIGNINFLLALLLLCPFAFGQAEQNNFPGGGTGTVSSVATTAPLTGGPITSTGTIACATCSTSTNGGAMPFDESGSGLTNPTADATFTWPISSLSGLTLAGTAPASVSTATGTNATSLFNINGVIGGADSNATGTAGIGSSPTITAGAGGAGTGTNAVGGAGGGVTISSGAGGASLGTGINANGGNIVFQAGAAGSGGSGTAGQPGSVVMPNGTCVTGSAAANAAGLKFAVMGIDTGLFGQAATTLGWCQGGNSVLNLTANGMELASPRTIQFSSTIGAAGAVDGGFSRVGPAVLGVGTGANGSTAGFLKTAQTLTTAADVTCGTGGTISSCTSFTAIPGLSATLPLISANWAFDCDLVVSQTTAAAANQFGVQTATNGATSLTASGFGFTAATTTTA